GFDSDSFFKPNYISIMSYNHNFGLQQNSGNTIIDFSPAKVTFGATATGGNSATTLNDTAATWTDDQWKDGFVEVSQTFGFTTGDATGVNTATRLWDTSQNWAVNQLAGLTVQATVLLPAGGLGRTQTLSIVSNDATSLTVGGGGFGSAPVVG